jgi:hypothetical protein
VTWVPLNTASPPSSVHAQFPDTLYDYLNFIGIALHKSKEILETLLENDINDYQMFKVLLIKELKSLGFNVGFISKFRTTVSKYRVYLSQSNQKIV